MVEKVRGKLFVTLLLVFVLCFGIFVINKISNVVAEEDNVVARATADTPTVEVVGAAVRYPDEGENIYHSTGLRFCIRLAGVTDVNEIENLGVLVNINGTPTIENTPLNGVGVNVEYIKDGIDSIVHNYLAKDDGLYMNVALMHIPANHFHSEFVCRAYYQLKDEEIVYSDVLTRSVIYVIKAAIEDVSEHGPNEQQKELLKQLRTASTDHTADVALGVGKLIESATDAKQGLKEAFCTCGAQVSTPVGLYHYIFDTDGGSDVQDIDAYSYDMVDLPNTIKDGAKFLGWYDENGNKMETVEVPYENKTGVTVRFKAKWLEYVTEEELVIGYDFDSAENIARVATNDPDTKISYDPILNAMAVLQAGAGEGKLTRLSGLITLEQGDKVVLNIDNYSDVDNGGSLRIMNNDDSQARNPVEIKKEDGFGYYSWTADKAYTGVYIGYINYAETTYYIKSLQVVKKQTLSVKQLEQGVSFSAAESLGYLTSNEYAIPAVYDEMKNTVKILPKEANKTVSINIEEFTLTAGDRISIRALSAINVGFLINGEWKIDLTEKDGTEFKNYIWTATETTTVTGMDIMPYTRTGEMYVQFVQVIKKQNLTTEQLEAGVDFNSLATLGYVTSNENEIVTAYDETKNAVKITPKVNNKTVSINVDEFILNAGDKIVVRALSAINVGFRVNEKWRMTLQEAGGTEFKDYVWTVTETTTVTGMDIIPYTQTGELYVQFVQVIRAQTIT